MVGGRRRRSDTAPPQLGCPRKAPVGGGGEEASSSQRRRRCGIASTSNQFDIWMATSTSATAGAGVGARRYLAGRNLIEGQAVGVDLRGHGRSRLVRSVPGAAASGSGRWGGRSNVDCLVVLLALDQLWRHPVQRAARSLAHSRVHLRGNATPSQLLQ